MLIFPSCAEENNTKQFQNTPTPVKGVETQIDPSLNDTNTSTPTPISGINNLKLPWQDVAVSVNNGITEVNIADGHIKELNVLWLIDNSVSMKESGLHHIAMQQFETFVDNYKDHANIGLVTATTPTSSFCIPQMIDRTATERDHDFGWNFEVTDVMFQNVSIINCIVESVSPAATLNRLFSYGGAFARSHDESFLDPHGFTAIIVVSDRASLSTDTEQLVSTLLESRFHRNLVSFYSFSSKAPSQAGDKGNSFTIGQDNSLRDPYTDYRESSYQTHCGTHYTDSYTNLSQQLGGKRFNICEQDWQPYFEIIKNETLSKQRQVFRLDGLARTSTIHSVSVGNTLITDYDIFALHPPLLILGDESISQHHTSLQVQYSTTSHHASINP
ncbi:MAG: hypothetical protein OXC44_00225 [Proteobacteria bacterium]|nr:hypothetical protein [Pseudomonadota bacterium]